MSDSEPSKTQSSGGQDEQAIDLAAEFIVAFRNAEEGGRR